MRKIWVLGAIPPEPSGGVATFVERLVNSRFAAFIAGVIDPYHGRKNEIPVHHVTMQRAGWLERLRVLAYLWRVRKYPLLINASRPRAVILLAPFLLFRRSRTMLILHHGDLRAPKAKLTTVLLRGGLKKFTKIACLSERQMSFYLDLKLPRSRLALIDSYLPPVETQVNLNDPPLRGVMTWIREKPLPLIIASGSGEEYYNHEWVVSAIESDPAFSSVRFLLCCYGKKNQLLQTLEERSRRSARFHYAHGLTPAQFEHVLRMCDVYARPTDVDSFGIALWDAAAFGKTIVASDVCRRPAKALLHRAGDRLGFVACLREAIRTNSMAHSPSDSLVENCLEGGLDQFLGVMSSPTRGAK